MPSRQPFLKPVQRIPGPRAVAWQRRRRHIRITHPGNHLGKRSTVKARVYSIVYLQFESSLPIYLTIHLLIYFSTCDNQPADQSTDQSTTYWLTIVQQTNSNGRTYSSIVDWYACMLVFIYYPLVLIFQVFTWRQNQVAPLALAPLQSCRGIWGSP